MKVSIVIPVFNKAPYLRKAVDSALSQTHDDIEVVAVDDGSNDDSPQILREMAAGRSNLVVHTQDNAGLSAARNAGMRMASGEYLMFHDADDALEPDAVEVLLRIALEHGSDVTGGVFRRHTTRNVLPVRAFQHDDFAMNFRADAALSEKYCTNISSCNKLFRVAFLREAGIEFTPGLYMQDVEFWLRVMFTSTNISQTSHIVSNYYFYPDSSSQSKTPQRFESLFRLYDAVESFFAQQHVRAFAHVGNHALMQAALRFFALWKLDEWKESHDSTDLDRLQTVLRRIPDADYVTFLERNRGPNAAILLLVREGDYAEALRIRHSPYSGSIAWRRVFGHLNTSQSIIAFARRAGRSPWRNAFYEFYYLAPHYLSRPQDWMSGVVRLGRRGLKLINRHRPRLWRIKSVLYPYLAPLRDRAAILLGRGGEPIADGDAVLPAATPVSGKKILVFGLGDLYRIGGVQLSYQRLFEHLCGAGHAVAFYSHRDKPDAATLYYPFPSNVAVEHYKLQDTANAWQAIAHIAQQHDPDCILIVNSGQPSLILAAALYDLPYPVVYSERGSPDYTLEHNWCSLRQREVTHVASDFSHVLMPGYVCAAPPTLRNWVRVIPSVTEPGHGMATPSQAASNGRYSILYTGRFSFEKDLDLLIRAFARIRDEFPRWDVVLIGEGPDQAELERLAGELGVAGVVHFPGALLDLDAVFAAYLQAHIFALPSRAEGCPLSLREAMAHGLPVVGFDSCSGTNEIIRHGSNGLLAESVDKVEGLAQALRALMEDAALRDTMGRIGAEDIKQFAPEVIHRDWERLLLDAAQWKGRREELRSLKREGAADAIKPLERTLQAVRTSGRSRNIIAFGGRIRDARGDADLLADYLLVYGTCLFDPLYYYAQHLDVKLSGVDPLEHYLLEGWRRGYRTHAEFAIHADREEARSGQNFASPLIQVFRSTAAARAKLLMAAPADLRARLEAEQLEQRHPWVDAQQLCARRVARQLHERIDWVPFSTKEVLETMCVG